MCYYDFWIKILLKETSLQHKLRIMCLAKLGDKGQHQRQKFSVKSLHVTSLLFKTLAKKRENFTTFILLFLIKTLEKPRMTTLVYLFLQSKLEMVLRSYRKATDHIMMLVTFY